MLTIRKANFDNEPCFCCTGTKKYLNNPKHCCTHSLYHKLPTKNTYMQAWVIVPKCEHCASKTFPVLTISIILSLTSLVASYFWMYSTNGWFISLIGALVHFVIAFVLYLGILSYAFDFVYKQQTSNYELVRIMTEEYGWIHSRPSENQTDPSFTEERFNNMLDDLVNIYGCELSDTPAHESGLPYLPSEIETIKKAEEQNIQQ